MSDDLLRMDHINSLPQPFTATLWGGDSWELLDIDVQTGLLRIWVAGKFQVMEIGDVKSFTDANGVEHDSDTFYSDYIEETE